MLSSSSQTNNQNNLETLCDWVRKVAKKNIRWHANHQGTEVKTFLLSFIRLQTPRYIKKAIHNVGIDPTKHSKFSDIQGGELVVKIPPNPFPGLIPIEQLYINYLTNAQPKSSTHKDDSLFTRTEEMERSSKNASRFSVGNCGETRNICGAIWIECTLSVRNKLGLSHFSSLPHMELVYFDFDNGDHCFNIVNRPLFSDLQNPESWVVRGKEVIIIDLWQKRFGIISVNKELALPILERCPAFEFIRKKLVRGDRLDCLSLLELGEGHSDRWLRKRKSPTFFLEKKHGLGFFNAAPRTSSITSVELQDERRSTQQNRRSRPRTYCNQRFVPYSST